MIGMLWYDNDPKKQLTEKMQKAADYYRQKYGRLPNVCLVHPKMINGETPSVNGMRIGTSKSVMYNHLFLGVE